MYVESIIHDFLDISGNELMFKYRALQGDPDYAPYWDRAEAIPEEYKYPTMAQGIDTILKEPKVLHSTSAELQSFLKANPEYNSKVTMNMSSTQYT